MSESCIEGALGCAGLGVAELETRAMSERRRAAGVSASGKTALDVLATGVCSAEMSSGARRGVLELSSSSSPSASTSWPRDAIESELEWELRLSRKRGGICKC